MARPDRTRTLLTPLVLALTLLGGCVNLAPDYQRPAAPVASQWPTSPEQGATGNAADMGWQQFFLEPRLQRVVELALNNNRDLRVAALNIDKARATYRIQDAERYPAISASASSTRERTVTSAGTTTGGSQSVQVGFSSYELDSAMAYNDGEKGIAFVYWAGSVIAGLAAAALGWWIASSVG